MILRRRLIGGGLLLIAWLLVWVQELRIIAVAHHFPNASITVVDIDQVVIDMVREYYPMLDWLAFLMPRRKPPMVTPSPAINCARCTAICPAKATSILT